VIADQVVDWGALLEVVWSSLLAGIGVTAIWAVAILGATRAIDTRHNGNAVAATAYWVLTAIALVAVGVSVVFGIVVMTQK
jgi:hypothetical protein